MGALCTIGTSVCWTAPRSLSLCLSCADSPSPDLHDAPMRHSCCASADQVLRRPRLRQGGVYKARQQPVEMLAALASRLLTGLTTPSPTCGTARPRPRHHTPTRTVGRGRCGPAGAMQMHVDVSRGGRLPAWHACQLSATCPGRSSTSSTRSTCTSIACTHSGGARACNDDMTLVRRRGHRHRHRLRQWRTAWKWWGARDDSIAGSARGGYGGHLRPKVPRDAADSSARRIAGLSAGDDQRGGRRGRGVEQPAGGQASQGRNPRSHGPSGRRPALVPTPAGGRPFSQHQVDPDQARGREPAGASPAGR